MISANKFKDGLTIEYSNDLWRIVKFQHAKPGKGNAFVRPKLKSLRAGAVQEYTFYLTTKVSTADIQTRAMQYLYNDGTSSMLMDTITHRQLEILEARAEREPKFLEENIIANIIMHDGETLDIDLPNTVDPKIVEAEPSAKGDTSSGGGKPTIMEADLVVNVSFSINQGDVLTVNTADSTYVSRMNGQSSRQKYG